MDRELERDALMSTWSLTSIGKYESRHKKKMLLQAATLILQAF